MKLTRVEKHKANGTIDVSETFDNGETIETSSFSSNSSGEVLQLTTKDDKGKKDQKDKPK